MAKPFFVNSSVKIPCSVCNNPYPINVLTQSIRLMCPKCISVLPDEMDHCNCGRKYPRKALFNYKKGKCPGCVDACANEMDNCGRCQSKHTIRVLNQYPKNFCPSCMHNIAIQ